MNRVRALFLLGAAALCCPAAAPCAAQLKGDALHKLEADPSPEAARRLLGLYRSVRRKDERFWIVRSLEGRLRRHADETAFEALVEASADRDADVQALALRALASFAALPEKALTERLLARLDALAGKAAKHSRPSVREGARELARAIEDRRREGPPAPKVEKEERPSSANERTAWRKALAWALLLGWLLGAPGLVVYGLWRMLSMKRRKQAVRTALAPAAIGPYSQAIRCGGVLYVSGQIPALPATGDLAAGGVAEQTEQALKNLGAILQEAGCGYQDVLKTTVYLTDLSAFPEMNSVYARFFPDPAPARATVQVSALPKGAKVEIEAVVRS